MIKPKNPSDDQRKLDRWKAQGTKLVNGDSEHQWGIARWIDEGAKKFGISRALDEGMTATGMTRGTLKVFLHTSRNVKELTRVNGLYFGHHRLVAALTESEQKTWLHRALNRKWSVATFAEKLKGTKSAACRPSTDSDGAVGKFSGDCDALLGHWGIKQLLNGDPPTPEGRESLINKITETAERLNQFAQTLREHWMKFEQLPAGLAFTSKDMYDENQRRVKAQGAGR